MTSHAVRRTRSSAARRAGYAVAVTVNAALLFGVNVWPGWEIVPFLTAGMNQVLGLINLTLAASVLVNVLNLIFDRERLRALGEVVTTATGLAAMLRLLTVFPFAFPEAGFDWALLARVLLILSAVGTGIALVVTAVTFIRFLPRLTIEGDAPSKADHRETTGTRH